jgi:hypothetical protein
LIKGNPDKENQNDQKLSEVKPNEVKSIGKNLRGGII